MNLGLRAYYPFNGNANDVSGNNNNPIFNNATLTSDQYGNPNSAYHFNGINNYMMIPNSASLNMANSISICAKVRATGYYLGACQNNMLVAKQDGDFLPGTYNLRFADPVLGCNSNPPQTHERFYGAGAVSSSPYVELNKWYSVVCTYDGTTAKIYVDCVLRSTNVIAQAVFQTNFNLYFGHMNDPQYPYWLNGDLDEIRIYDRAINQEEVNAYSGCAPVTSCTNWLETLEIGASVKIGDLDVSGNQVTVEAQFNRTAPYSPDYLYAGDIVSKHDTPGDVNYLLRPNDAEITTTNGYAIAAAGCEIELNQTYHAALVYNGTSLKFYRNGFLMSEVPASGNLIQNNYSTTIGDYAYPFPDVGTNFVGYINEVRIWNVARTQAQIQAYMNTSLPNPPAQTGLLAYYTFDNLLNKQGNTAWNGALNWTAAINATNPHCAFLPDSCNGILPVTITDFKASVVDNKKIAVTWNTEDELNIKDYTIKRSTSGYGQSFVTIGTVVSKANARSNTYSFIDNTAKPNTLYYYKLVSSDRDGRIKEGPIKTARINNKEFYSLIYPNPTTGAIKVFINNAPGDVNIRVINNLGQIITGEKAVVANTNPVPVDISNAAKGMYWIIIESGEERTIEKIIKQ